MQLLQKVHTYTILQSLTVACIRHKWSAMCNACMYMYVLYSKACIQYSWYHSMKYSKYYYALQFVFICKLLRTSVYCMESNRKLDKTLKRKSRENKNKKHSPGVCEDSPSPICISNLWWERFMNRTGTFKSLVEEWMGDVIVRVVRTNTMKSTELD